MRLIGFMLALTGCARTVSIVDKPVDVPEPVEDVPDPAMPFEPDLNADTPDTAEDVVNEDPVVPFDPIPVADAPVYAHTNDTLYVVNPSTGVATEVANFTVGVDALDGIVDIAIDMQGRMFGGDRGVQAGGPYNLYRIDPSTAEATYVCSTPQEMTALTFTSSGELIAGGADGLVKMDIANGCALTILVRDNELVTSGDVVGLPDGLIYWTVRGRDGDQLVVVDPDNGLIGHRGVIDFDRLFGLAYDADADRLYGFSADGETVEINGSDASSSLKSSNDFGWWGATTNPVLWVN